MHEVLQGHCDPRFDKVAEALADEITSGEEVGASIAIDIDGEIVVDMWGGHADARQDGAMGREHDRQRLLLHQDAHRAGRV